VRFPGATHLVILMECHARHDWLVEAVFKRLREELGKLRVAINEDKSRIVDLRKGESFSFLGFEFRLVRSLKGRWRPQYTPKLKKRTALLAKLREIFRRQASQPVSRVIELINPILRGWVNYFAVGHSSRCFAFIEDWVNKKIRRHLMRARKRKGFGWKRWSTEWLYPRAVQRLSNALLRALLESHSRTIGHITLDAEATRKAECSKWACSV
jgi:RNA-directed DNA polymerase